MMHNLWNTLARKKSCNSKKTNLCYIKFTVDENSKVWKSQKKSHSTLRAKRVTNAFNIAENGWDLLRNAEISLEMLIFTEKCWVLFRNAEKYLNMLRFAEKCWDLLKNTEICWDLLRYAEIYWNVLRFAEIYWDLLRLQNAQ